MNGTVVFTRWGSDDKVKYKIAPIDRPQDIADKASTMNDAGWSFHVWPETNTLVSRNPEGESIAMDTYHKKGEAPDAVDRLINRTWEVFNDPH